MQYSIRVAIAGELPDFRLIAVFLWGEDHSYDSDGDSYNPASRNWTWLHMHSREFINTAFEVEQSEDDLLIYTINSDNLEIGNRAAYFLAIETKGKILANDGQWSSPNSQLHALGNFDLTNALLRSYTSCIRQSTLDNPYPR